MIRHLVLAAVFAFLPVHATLYAKKPSEKGPKAPVVQKTLPVVRVNVTVQSYDFMKPWSKKAPNQRRAIGPVLAGKQILVTGELVTNATYVELEKPDTSEKTPAKVEVVDYDANLALIKPEDEKFLDGIPTLSLAETKVGETVTIWQIEGNGTLLPTSALVTAAEVARYPTDEISLLLYRLTTALQPRDGSFTTPVVDAKNQLIGMLVRFDSRSQAADVIPTPVIRHFLKGAESKPYVGFPRVGVSFTNLRDPQLRRFAGLPADKQGGIYVTQTLKNGSADKAGIQPGDVVLKFDGVDIDHDGNYQDPRYGKLSIIHLLCNNYFPGAEVPIQIWRKEKEETLKLKLQDPSEIKTLIEPYVFDRAPRYYILGGLVFQELSRQYLREWGPEWVKKAPERFVYFDRYQSTLFEGDPRERIVILGGVLPTPATLGYEALSGQVVTEVNGVKLKSLKDMEEAVASAKDGFHQIRFEEAPREIYLDAEEVKQLEPALKENYGIPSLKHLE